MSARRFVFLFVLGLSASPPAAAQKTGERGLSQQAAEPGFTGTRRVVIIGISRYLNLEGKKQLHYAAADAQMMYEFFRSRAGRSVDTQNIRLLVDTGARAGHMTEALRWLREHSQPGDEAIIYFAGHGAAEMWTGAEGGYLLATNADSSSYADGGVVRVSELQDAAATMATNRVRVLLITDACRAGKLVGTPEAERIVVGDPDGARRTVDALSHPWGDVAKLVSSQPSQSSWEGAQWGGGHGVFTYFLVKGLQGMADTDPKDGVVTLGELETFIRSFVRKETGSNQVPQRIGDSERPLALVDTSTARAASIAMQVARPRSAAGGRGGDSMPGAAMVADTASVDTTLARTLEAFTAAISARALLEPPGTSAWAVYRRLLTMRSAAAMLLDIKSTLAAALEDDAQEVVSDHLRVRTKQPTPARLRGAAKELERVLQLLGSHDVSARSLRSRQLFLEGYAAVREGRYASALPLLEQSVSVESQGAAAYNALGLAYLGLGRLAEARRAFNDAHARAPRWSYPVHGLGLVDAQEGRQSEAEVNFEQAIAEDSSYMEPRRQLASLYVATSRPKDAERVLRSAVAADSTDAASYADLGALLFDRQRYLEAVDVFERAIRLDSTKLDPHIRLSLSLYYLKRDAAALAVIQRATTMRNANALSWRTLGFLRGQHRDWAGAVTAYRHAQQLDPSAAAIADELGRVYLDAGRLAAADSAFRSALGLDAGYAAAYDGLGKVNEARGWPTQAERYYQEAVARDSLNPARHQALASFYFARGRFAESETAIRRSLALDPRDAWWTKNLALALHKLGREKEAEGLYLRAIALDSLNFGLHNSLGLFYGDLERFGEAERALRRAAELAPDAPEVAGNLGWLYSKLGRTADELREYVRAAALDSLNSDRYNQVGATYFELARYAEAERAFHRAAELAPRSALLAGNLGLVYGRLNRPEDAVREYRRAIALDSLNAERHSNLGGYYWSAERYREAAAAFRRAAALAPNSAQDAQNLGLVLEKLGQAADAEREFRRAVGLDSLNFRRHGALAGFLQRQGRLPEAEASYLRGLAVAGDSAAAAATELGDFYQNSGQPAKAEERYRAALARDSTSVGALVSLGNLYWAQGKMPAAKQSWSAVLRFDRDNALALNNVAWALYGEGRAADATPLSDQSLAHEATLSTADLRTYLDTRANIWLDAGDPRRALESFDRALQNNAHPDAGLYFGRAMSLLELGREREAVAAFRQAVAVDAKYGDRAFLAGTVRYSAKALARFDRLRALAQPT